jgi:hypothetical protein
LRSERERRRSRRIDPTSAERCHANVTSDAIQTAPNSRSLLSPLALLSRSALVHGVNRTGAQGWRENGKESAGLETVAKILSVKLHGKTLHTFMQFMRTICVSTIDIIVRAVCLVLGDAPPLPNKSRPLTTRALVALQSYRNLIVGVVRCPSPKLRRR